MLLVLECLAFGCLVYNWLALKIGETIIKEGLLKKGGALVKPRLKKVAKWGYQEKKLCRGKFLIFSFQTISLSSKYNLLFGSNLSLNLE